jgi:ABC-type branched-subunit amino acid transport system ATPase component
MEALWAAFLRYERSAAVTQICKTFWRPFIRPYQTKTSGLVIIIEHDMSIVEAISDKVLVMHLGQVLAFDSYEKVRLNPEVQAVYAGGTK